jgi:dihydrofolate synthase / folylpolyglutamate synthase
MTYPAAIDWLFSTQWFGIKLGLDSPRHLLKETLAYPDHGVKVVHVAGTNGKGSTCAMIDSIARAAGRRTGLFTSPHLVDFRERIQVSGQMIPKEECARLLSNLRSVCEAMDPHPTFFEITLALALRWFREKECEWVILETGMGGRHDATTAVPADICAITPIGMDHSEWLGDTLEKIASEKAGVFLTGIPAVSAPQDPSAAITLEKEANEKRTPLEFIDQPLRGYHIALAGEHQAWNAALAVHTLHKAGLPLDPDIVRHGLSHLTWPGRFERIGDIILDGAHNPHAAQVLADTWCATFPDQKPFLLFSAASGKDITGILNILTPLAEHIFLCPLDSPRALPVAELAAQLPATAPPHECHDSFLSAFQAARAANRPILIAGSLFLIGEARAYLTDGIFQSSAQ